MKSPTHKLVLQLSACSTMTVAFTAISIIVFVEEGIHLPPLYNYHNMSLLSSSVMTHKLGPVVAATVDMM